MIEILKFKNNIRATLKDAQTGDVIRTVTTPNVVPDVGEQLTLDALGGTSGSFIKYCAIGHGVGTTSAGSIILKTELVRTDVVYTRAGQIGTFSSFFDVTQGNSGTIKEIGFFGGTSAFTSTNAGTMFNRVEVASGFIKTADFTLTVDLDVTF